MNRYVTSFLIGAGIGMALRLRTRPNPYTFRGRTVVITGGSRGLGLVMARILAREGARLAILARDPAELDRAESELRLLTDVMTIPCDLRSEEQVRSAIGQVVARYARLDVLINNAGIIQVGPLEHMTIADFTEAMATHLYGPLFCVLAALPHLRSVGGGRVVNVTSVGGKIAVPHLLPYCASKFALVGLSEGLRVELHKDNIRVTTVCPGLMRTGSPRNARFKGQHRREYAWFAIADSLPLLSMSAETAARQILQGCRRGAARVTLGVHTKGALLANELFPGATAAALSLANRLLPGARLEQGFSSRAGHESQSQVAPSWLTRLSDEAARTNNEVG